MAYDFLTASRQERWAHTAHTYCRTIQEERARLASMKEMRLSAGERRRVSRNIGSWMKLVAGLATAVEGNLS